MRNAPFLRRLGAMIYDGLLVLALLFLATLPFIAVRGGEPVEPGENLLYRLVLGQPNQEDLLEALPESVKTMSVEELRETMLQLSPSAVLFSGKHGTFRCQ